MAVGSRSGPSGATIGNPRAVPGAGAADAAAGVVVAGVSEKRPRAAVTSPTGQPATIVTGRAAGRVLMATTNHCPPPTACGRRPGPMTQSGRSRLEVIGRENRGKGAKARVARAGAAVDGGAARVDREAKAARGAKPAREEARGSRARADSGVAEDSGSDGLRMTRGRRLFPGAGGTTLRPSPDVTRRTTRDSTSWASRTRWARMPAGVRGRRRMTRSSSRAGSTRCSTCRAGSRPSAS